MSDKPTQTTNTAKIPLNKNRLGGLWKKTNENGSFLNGLMEINGKTYRIIVSKAKTKATANSPDYNIFEILDAASTKTTTEKSAAPESDADDIL